MQFPWKIKFVLGKWVKAVWFVLFGRDKNYLLPFEINLSKNKNIKSINLMINRGCCSWKKWHNKHFWYVLFINMLPSMMEQVLDKVIDMVISLEQGSLQLPFWTKSLRSIANTMRSKHFWLAGIPGILTLHQFFICFERKNYDPLVSVSHTSDVTIIHD